MNIGEAARRSGVTAKMIRHYEAQGLIARGMRSEAGYRRFSDTDVDTLRFIRQARVMGFSLAQIGDLLSLWRDPCRSSQEVKRLASAHVAELDARIRELTAMRDALAGLAQHCHGDARPDCPILTGLADGAVTAGTGDVVDAGVTAAGTRQVQERRAR